MTMSILGIHCHHGGEIEEDLLTVSFLYMCIVYM